MIESPVTVFDCGVFLQGLLSKSGPAVRCLELTEESRIRLVLSEEIKVPKHFAYSRDPEDEPYLNLAIETEAVFLVSRDNDLLDLMTDYTDEAKDFRRRFRTLRIVHPVEFLQIIERKD